MTPDEVYEHVRTLVAEGRYTGIRLKDADGPGVLTFSSCPVWGEGMVRADTAWGRIYGNRFIATRLGTNTICLIAYRGAIVNGILRIFIDEGTEAVL